MEETVINFINDFLFKYISYVVIAFAGDALICVFPQKNYEDLCECCRRAIICGLRLKKIESLNLTAHIAISFGNICFGKIGGWRNEFVSMISGDCLTELSACIADASSKEAVITDLCHKTAIFDETFNISHIKLSSGNVKILEGEVEQAQATMIQKFHLIRNPVWNSRKDTYDKFYDYVCLYVPRPIRSAITVGSLRNFCELREITTIFVKLDSYDSEVYRKISDLQPYLIGAQEILGRSGGFLRQFLIDDKGCVLIGLWGVPFSSFPNNCSRAVHCAVAISSFARSIAHVCSIGISTGTAFCGTIGSEIRQDYVAMGDSVNMAARLMGKAKTRILVDDETYQRLPTSIGMHMTMGESLLLKGKNIPIIPYTFHGDSIPVLAALDDLKNERSILLTKNITELLKKELDKLLEYSSHKNDIPINKQSGEEEGTSSPYPLVKFIIAEGAAGMGHMKVAECFINESHHRNFQHFKIKSLAEESFVAYSMIRKLFYEIVGIKDLDTDIDVQKECIMELLKQIYCTSDSCFNNTETNQTNQTNASDIIAPVISPSLQEVVQQRYGYLKYVFNFKWSFDVTNLDDIVVATPEQDNLNTSFSNTFKLSTKIRASSFYGQSTLQDIFRHILSKHAYSTILIENGHFCDEVSLKELCLLFDHTRLPVLALITFQITADNRDEERETGGIFYGALNSPRVKNTAYSPGTPKALSKTKTISTSFDRSSSFKTNNSFQKMANVSGNKSESETSIPTYKCESGVGGGGREAELVKDKTKKKVKRFLFKKKSKDKILRRLSKYGFASGTVCSIWECLKQMENCIVLPLTNLTYDEVYNLLNETLGGNELPSQFAELVHSVTGGNPFWCDSIAKYVRASGIEQFQSSLRISDANETSTRSQSSTSGSSFNSSADGGASDKETVSDIMLDFQVGQSMSVNAEDFSRRLQRHILCLIDTLTVENQTILKYASIIGDEFDIDILEAVLPSKLKSDLQSLRVELKDKLGELCNEGIIMNVSDKCKQSTVFGFQNDLIRKTLYDLGLPRYEVYNILYYASIIFYTMLI